MRSELCGNDYQTRAKYHHLVPRAYMKPWISGSHTLQVEYMDCPGEIKPKNIDKIGGITDYYSIMAGMLICTEQDAEKIFSEALKYKVSLNDSVLSSPLDLNNHFLDFDKWIISRADGSVVRKKRIKREIQKVKIRDIEINWNGKYETKWGNVVKKIESNVVGAQNGQIEAFDKEFLMKFFTALDWRGFTGNRSFEDAFGNLMGIFQEEEISEDDRILPCLTTTVAEIRHCLLLKYYRQFFEDSGPIYKMAMENLAKTNFHFLVSRSSEQFITCDSPAFLHQRVDGFIEGLLPITPNVLMLQGRCDDTTYTDHFYVTHINDEQVEVYNQAIRSNATEFVVHPPHSA